MIYEQRIYYCLPGRLPNLLNRFQNTTLKIWERHGIKQAGFWTTLVGESNNELTYMLAWDSLADRDKKWAAFRASDEWKSYSTQPRYAFETIVSNINNSILTPTAYSQI